MADILVDASSVDGKVINKKYPVKWMNNTFQGSPVKPNPYQETYICDILDAVLVNGYNEHDVDTIEYLHDVKQLKFTCSTSNGIFQKHSIINIIGSSNEGLNGEHRVIQSNADEFWFTIDYPDDLSNMSTIGLKINYAPLGWELAFSQGTRRIYRSPNANSPRPYVIIEGNRYKSSNRGEYYFMAMSTKMIDINTKSPDAFTIPRVTDDKLNLHSAGTGWVNYGTIRSRYSSAQNLFDQDVNYANNPYTIIGDDRTFILSFSGAGQYATYDVFNTSLIGDIDPISSWDKGSCVIGNNYRWNLSEIKNGQMEVGGNLSKYLLFLFSPQAGGNIQWLIDHQGYGTRDTNGSIVGENLTNGQYFFSGGHRNAPDAHPNNDYIMPNPSAYGNLTFISKSMKYVTDNSPVTGVSIRGKIPWLYWIQQPISGISNDNGVIIDNLRGDDGVYYQLFSYGTYDDGRNPNSGYYRNHRLFINIEKWR